MCEEGIRTLTMDKSKLSMMKKLCPCGAEDDGTPGSEEKLIENIDHVYMEKLMWDCPYYDKDSQINPDMDNDQKTPDRTQISAVRSWFEERGMSVHWFLMCVFLEPLQRW